MRSIRLILVDFLRTSHTVLEHIENAVTNNFQLALVMGPDSPS